MARFLSRRFNALESSRAPRRLLLRRSAIARVLGSVSCEASGSRVWSSSSRSRRTRGPGSLALCADAPLSPQRGLGRPSRRVSCGPDARGRAPGVARQFRGPASLRFLLRPPPAGSGLRGSAFPECVGRVGRRRRGASRGSGPGEPRGTAPRAPPRLVRRRLPARQRPLGRRRPRTRAQLRADEAAAAGPGPGPGILRGRGAARSVGSPRAGRAPGRGGSPQQRRRRADLPLLRRTQVCFCFS